jgi:hypothetical protein
MRGRDYSLLEAPRSRRNFGRMVGKEEVTAREPGFPEVNRSLPCFSALSPWSRNGLQGDQQVSAFSSANLLRSGPSSPE